MELQEAEPISSTRIPQGITERDHAHPAETPSLMGGIQPISARIAGDGSTTQIKKRRNNMDLKQTRVMVLGVTGMLGHKVIQTLAEQYPTIGTVRESEKKYKQHLIIGAFNLVGGVDAYRLEATVAPAIDAFHPDVIVNCIGIVKQLREANDMDKSTAINTILPLWLQTEVEERNTRLIHISTDCVFDGLKGGYTEADEPNATDIYGKTKAFGEVLNSKNTLTLRTSIVGRELHTQHGLVEWFLSNQGKEIKGYANSIFSGVTTLELSNLISKIIGKHQDLNGLYHVAANPIDKYQLLSILNNITGETVKITPDYQEHINRSLNADKLCHKIGYAPPGWRYMLSKMMSDPTPYTELRMTGEEDPIRKKPVKGKKQ